MTKSDIEERVGNVIYLVIEPILVTLYLFFLSAQGVGLLHASHRLIVKLVEFFADWGHS